VAQCPENIYSLILRQKDIKKQGEEGFSQKGLEREKYGLDNKDAHEGTTEYEGYDARVCVVDMS